MMIQKFQPRSPTSTLITYEVYKNRHSTSESFHLIADMYERVMREDKVLCNAAQKNLNRGVFNAGLLHPKYEKAPLFFQGTVREVVGEHWRLEKEVGREVWPARREAVGSEGDEEVCEGVACGEKKEELAW